ncbi:hypothetical protein AB4J90_17330 [Geobacillus thermodenitrificans]|uniref:hypothetical protein n=2 Tax=Geobacillus TaxID=129337 RepID=UPI000C05AB2A|nr:hypothetical protein [Geobacillus thermodenitrificans]ATO37825.1 hypothetical protein GTID1_11835 [Geobacillus thermodenitrificans]
MKVGEETLTQALDFEIAEVAEIELKEQVLKYNDETGRTENLKYKVLDENGLDITKLVKVDVATTKGDKFTAKEGAVEVTLKPEDGLAFVELSYELEDGTVVKSKRVKVTAEEAKAVDFASDWSLAAVDKNGKKVEPSYDDEDYEQDTTLNMGSTKFIDFELIDQFGDKIADNKAIIKYETLDASVVVIDEETGKLTPRKEGTAVVRASLIENGKVIATKTVEFKVVAKAKLAGIEVESSTLEVIAESSEEIEITLLDQFGNKFDFDGDVTVESSDKDKKVVKVANEATWKSVGKYTLNVEGVAKGTATLTIKAGDFQEKVTVKVVEAGEVASYEVKGFKSELLVKDVTNDNVDDTQMTLDVIAVDEKGLTIPGKNPEFTISIKDKNGKEVSTISSANPTISAKDLKDKEGPFTLTVKVGTLTVFTGEFKVTDNRKAPEFTFTSNKIVVGGPSADTTFLDALDDIIDFGTAEDDIEIIDVDFVSSKASVIEDGDGSVTIHEGKEETVVVYLDTIKIKVVSDEDAEEFTLDLNGEKVYVTVDTKASLADVTAPAEITSDAESLQIVFDAKDISDLAFIEIDHNLENVLPEFKLYADPSNVWGDAKSAEQAEKLGVSASYDKDSQKWVLTLNNNGENSALAKILENASDAGYEFKLYQKVVDIHGNESSDFNNVTPEITTTIVVKKPVADGEDA